MATRAGVSFPFALTSQEPMKNSPATSVPADSWEFAGWGTASRISDLDTADLKVEHLDQPTKHKLGTWSSTPSRCSIR
jgi:hypothetical protein